MVLAATPTCWNVLWLCENFQKPFTRMCILLDQCLDNNLTDMHGTCSSVKLTFIGVFCSNSRRLCILGSSKKVCPLYISVQIIFDITILFVKFVSIAKPHYT